MDDTDRVGRPGRVVLGLSVDVVVMAQARTHPAPGISHPGEHQHPAAPDAKFSPGPEVLVERKEEVSREENQRDADDALHDAVDPIRQNFGRNYGEDTKNGDDRPVAESVESTVPEGGAMGGRQVLDKGRRRYCRCRSRQ